MGSVAVFIGKAMSKETDYLIFLSFVGIFIFLQTCFTALALHHKFSHARLLQSFGRVDPEAINFLIEDGYKFQNGILSDDLDFTKQSGPNLTDLYEQEDGDFGNPERWAAVDARENFQSEEDE